MLLTNLDLLATAPGGAARLRELILTLAVQGKLVPQDPADKPARVLLQTIRAEKDRLIAEGQIKRDKPLAEIAEEETPFELPQGWRWARLGDLCSYIQRGKGPVYADHSPHRVVSQKCVRWHGLDLAPARFVTTESLSKYEPIRLLRAGDLLWNSTGTGTIGRACLVPLANDKDGLVADSHVTVVRPMHIDSRFLWRWIQSPYVQDEIEGSASGTTNQIELNTATVVNHLFPLPPLGEQSRIVTRVDELMRLCDALEVKGQLETTQHAQLVSTLLSTLTGSTTPEELANHWQRVAQHLDLLLDRPEAIDALEQTLLQLAVRGLLVPQDPAEEPANTQLARIRTRKDRLIAEGKIKRDKPLPPIPDEERPFELPMGWEWVRVNDVVETLNGYAFKSEWFKQTGVRLLRNLNVGHGRVDWSQSAMLDPVSAKDYEPFALRKGDIVLSLDRPIISTGLKYALIRASDLPCLLLQRVARLAPWLDAVSPEFLVLWLQSDLFVSTIDPGRSNGVPHISTKQVGGLALALPPLAEQSRIVTRVTALRGLCADLRQRLKASQVTQSHLAQALVESSNVL